MGKYDWLQLKHQFVTGSWFSLADFFRSKRVKYNSKSRTRAKGWLIERAKYQEKLTKQALDQLMVKDVSTQYRLQKISRQLQLKGLQKLNQTTDIDPKTAFKLLVTGLQEERKAYGLDSPVKPKRQSINTGKTNLDLMVERMDYQELMVLISQLKQ
jgi:hypothetical protein